MFVDSDGKLISAQLVKEGESAQAPENPSKTGYNFIGWDTDFSSVTENLTVKAKYEKKDSTVVPATTGTLKIEVSGGTGFTISVNGAGARPQGTSYVNSKMPIGATVTAEANAIEDKEFIGWINPANGQVITTELSYTFTTSGNDFFKAMYKTEVEGVNIVTFKNDKAYSGNGQIIDMQYYLAEDDIELADTSMVVRSGYEVVGWDKTVEDIKAKLQAGEDVTAIPEWEKVDLYVEIDITGGTITTHGGEKDGKYLANAKTTVEASAAESGMKFAYWTADGKVVGYDTTYSFYPKVDVKLEAVFVTEDTEIKYEVLVSVTSFTATKDGQFNFAWYVPTTQNNLTYLGAGIIAVKEDNYNEEDFYNGTTNKNVYDRTLDTKKPIGSAYWVGPVASGETWYAKAWVKYTDNATGEVVTVYSDLFEAVKD